MAKRHLSAPRRWNGWRVRGPVFPLEIVITRRRPPPVSDDPRRDCGSHGYTYRTGSAGCPSCPAEAGRSL